MALIACTECGQEISDKAISCPKCGAPVQAGSSQSPVPAKERRGTGRWLFWTIAVALVAIVAIPLMVGKESGGSNAYIKSQLCDQSKEAAHYIAAESIGNEDVPTVVGHVVADRKYPDLDDKLVGNIGLVVITERAENKTPDEISDDIYQACQNAPR